LLAGTSGASLGTLLDLARRGVLKIEETKRSRLYGRQFQIVLYDDSARLAPHENVLLESVFKPGETAVTMRDFFSRLTRRRQFPDAVREELRSAGYINPVRETARRKLSIAGFILLLAGLALFVEGLVFDSSFATPVGVSLFVSGFLGLVLAATQPIWSDAGVLVAAQWKAFARYLSKLSRGFELLRDTASFERFLPYAAAFGLAAPFLKQRAKQGGVELPPWFHAMDSADASDAFVAFVSTGDASSSGGGGSGGGGGDASGGGSSGAG
jgi:uncharacterized membrane protein YgcG